MDMNQRYDKALEIHKTARLHLVDHIGNMVFATTPRYHQDAGVWHVPLLCRTERGSLPVGEMEFDNSGRLLTAPTAEQVEEIATQMLQATPTVVRAPRGELEEAGFRVVAP